MNVLEHLPNLNNVFKEINKILKIRGNLIDLLLSFIKYMVLHSIIKDLRKIFFMKPFQKKNINLLLLNH